MAARLRTVKQNQASFLKNSTLVYVHCVSKDDFPIGLAHFGCVKLICREIHLSFIDKMNETRVALVPFVVDETKIDEMFENVKSPALIRILSSCDTEVRKSFWLDCRIPGPPKSLVISSTAGLQHHGGSPFFTACPLPVFIHRLRDCGPR